MAEKEAVLESGTTVEYDGTAGGWGSLKGIAQIFGKEWDTPAALETLMRQNKPKGLMCTSCSRAKPADHHTFEFCENGAKATLWELTTRRCTQCAMTPRVIATCHANGTKLFEVSANS
jgi:hypothetical protein